MEPMREITVGSPKPMRSSPSLPRAFDAPKSRPKLLTALRKQATAESSESDTESETDASESNDDLHIPANNIQSTAGLRSPRTNMESSEDENQSEGEGAYERMKKRLAAEKASTESQQTQRVEPKITTVTSSEDEDEMPVRTNGRKINAKKPKVPASPASPTPSIRSRRSSPGLFVTPHASPAKKQPQNLEDGRSPRPQQKMDLQERVERIRAERIAKQKEEQAQQEAQKKTTRRQAGRESGSDTDGEDGRRLTQHSKPTRRAGKKALEAMARDQQRISRNMQLTHQSKTKKRYSTKDLFARMGYAAPDGASPATGGIPTPDASSAIASSDAEANQIHHTPPVSPPEQKDVREQNIMPEEAMTMDVEQDTAQSPASAKIDKGKGRAPEFQHLPMHPWMKKTQPTTVQRDQVNLQKPSDDAMIELSDSDEDLEIEQRKSRFPVFDRVPLRKQEEGASLVYLRSLAQLTTSPKNVKKDQKLMSRAEMELLLAQKARQQAQKEREEKIEQLKRRGIHIETEEEREKHQTEVEDMVAQLEKQRQEDLSLAKLEREEAKKNGEVVDDLPSSDESDGDYVGSGDENAEEVEDDDEEAVELELSGSEDEDDDESNDLVEEMADEDEKAEETSDMQQVNEDAEMEDEEMIVSTRKQAINRSRNRVVDDEDESENEAPNGSPTQQATQDDAMAAFGFGNPKLDLGLTQMFAGTMANLESGSQSGFAEPEQDSLDFLRSLPETQPGANFSQTSDLLVPNSQSLVSPQKQSNVGPESQFSLGISQLVLGSPAKSQLNDLPEPTQDVGFSFSRSPAGVMALPSTVDTVMVSVAESPMKQKKGKLQRGRRDTTVELSDVDDDLAGGGSSTEEDDMQHGLESRDGHGLNPRNAFSKMNKAAKKQKAIDDFNKKTSLAKDAVMEQAEESEDEYAGLGGASDEDSGEEDEEMEKMIDNNDVEVDERQLAALFADKARKEDEKNTNQLYKDLMNGGLRKRAGREAFDMSDSEDEEEMRRRKKRAEFQRTYNALKSDERLGKIAEDEKKSAFFKTFIDVADEADYDFLDMPADEANPNSQSQETPEEGTANESIVPDSQIMEANTLKRKSASPQKENRPPPQMRRTAASDKTMRRPMTFADVQHSVSELLDDPRIIVPDSQFSDDDDDDDNDKDNRKDTAPNPTRKPIIDRLSLSRQNRVDESSRTVDDNNNMAFHSGKRTSMAPGFKVPSLIRKATSSFSNVSEKSVSSGSGAAGDGGGVRRGGTGRSNIHAQAREAERRAAVEKSEGKRKEALRKKVAGGRKGRSVLVGLEGGFE